MNGIDSIKECIDLAERFSTEMPISNASTWKALVTAARAELARLTTLAAFVMKDGEEGELVKTLEETVPLSDINYQETEDDAISISIRLGMTAEFVEAPDK